MNQTELMQKVQDEINKMEPTMSFYYAHLNEENIVVGVSEAPNEFKEAPEYNLIPIPTYDVTLMGKVYKDNKFIDNPNPPSGHPGPTDNT